MRLPISVIMMTKDEADNITHTLPPLITHFDDVHVLDTRGIDNTATIARRLGAKVITFNWNGEYPKKKQWGIDNLPLKNEWIFQIDADELVTNDFISELNQLDQDMDGYFVPAQMSWNGTLLNHGLRNNKLCLYKKSKFTYPVIDDLDNPGGWEVEGHYQPIAANKNIKIGQIKTPLIHNDTSSHWIARHKKYAVWEAEMNAKNAWPVDPIPARQISKRILRTVPVLRSPLILLYSYVFKLGFLDGRAGFDYAAHRAHYAAMIRQARKERRTIQ